MKKVVAILLVLTLVFVATACSTPGQESSKPSTESVAPSTVETTDAATTTDSAPQGGFRVASINWTNTHGWRITYEAQLKEVADEYIAQGLISEYQAFCPNQDAALEIQYFQQCINDGYDIILINAGGSTGLDACFEEAVEKGIIAIPVDNLYPFAGVVGVQTDQAVWAGTNFDAMVAHFNGAPAKVVNFTGMEGTTGSGLRGDTWDAGLAANPNFEVVYTGTTAWSQTESKRVMSEFLATGIEYDAILTEEACVGILEAIEEAGAPYPEFMTSDEEVGYIRMLDRINADSTVIDFVVIENPPGIGASALKLAVRMAQGKEFKDGMLQENAAGTLVAYYTPTYMVTPDTLDDAIAMWKDAADTDQMSTYLTEEAADAYFK